MIKYFKILIVAIIIFGLIVGLFISLVLLNWQSNQNYQDIEVNFIHPRQALIFWKTKEPNIGYIKFGESRTRLDHKEYQTSSNETEIHTVVIEKIPTEGIFIQLRTEQELPFVIWHKTKFIKYDYQNTQNNVYHP